MKRFLKNTGYMLTHIRKIGPFYIPIVIFISLTAFVGPLSTVLAPKIITDELLSGDNLQRIIYIIVAIAIANLIRIVLKSIYSETYVPFTQVKLVRKINMLIMEKTLKLDLSCYDAPDFYDKYKRALNQSDTGLISFINAIGNLFDRFVYVSTVIAIITSLDPILIIFSFVCVFIIFFMGQKDSKYRYETDKKITTVNRQSEYAKRIYYLPQYAKDMRVSSLGFLLKNMYQTSTKQKQYTVKKRSKFLNIIRISDEGLRVIIFQVVTMVYLVFQIRAGNLGVSSFIALFLATMQLSYELFSFVQSFKEFYKLSLYTDDLRAILNYESKIEEDNPLAPEIESTISSININNVSFTYHGNKEKTLNNINIEIKGNQRIALVGYNGAGKTTLIKLLLRLYDPTEGNIQINDIQINKFKLSSIRQQIGVVFQDYNYYSMTIAENVLMKEVITNEDRVNVTEALKKADLYDFVSTLPNGIDTVITREFNEDGILLSGGQAQKLAVARIFACCDKKIIIMDEASSALDPISESTLNKNILSFCKNKILIIISHRLSTTKDVDCIYYLQEGNVCEHGTHSELMLLNSKYAKMFNTQAEKYHTSPKNE